MTKRIAITAALAALFSTTLLPDARAFCGFYVAKADTKIFNQASKVVLVRQDDKTVLTMANDYQGDLKEFAVVIPVPTFIEKGQINVGDPKIIDHLDAFTAPRLVEYFDPDPCQEIYDKRSRAMGAPGMAVQESAGDRMEKAKTLGVTIEAEYTVGEYDIVILSAKESSGLETWLKGENYRIPEGASEVLGSYIKQDMRFFVAKVNLKEQDKLGFSYLRPLQVAYESPKFMLPIRLGTVNAKGPQELFVFAITPRGRVETTNYRTVKLPTGMDVPIFVKEEFSDFYRSMFDQQVKSEGMKSVFLEYAWNMNWCDPCAADPLSADELQSLGVFWLGGGPKRGPKAAAQQAYVTRLHVRYDARTFPEDLVFQETADSSNFQGRYVLRHPFKGDLSCKAGEQYKKNLLERQEREAQTLASLTGWEVGDIRGKIDFPDTGKKPDGEDPDGTKTDDGKTNRSWWEKLWK